ncbi:hypothetical protein [Alkalihalophilus marmarensis]|uniref:hypothetical protein n=1 Tax=Alkalihalophilus marmarensis TaxID=521377 RepID=UPI002E1A29AA|nr:hypothetical protein [Alkalihalophilus marmarensis]
MLGGALLGDIGVRPNEALSGGRRRRMGIGLMKSITGTSSQSKRKSSNVFILMC